MRLPGTLKMVVGLLVTAAVFQQLRFLKVSHSHHEDQQAAMGYAVLPREPRNDAAPAAIIAAAPPHSIDHATVHTGVPASAQPVLHRVEAQSLVRTQVYVFWDKLNTWYLADVEGYDPDHKLHSLRYADGFVEHIDLDQVKYKGLSHADEIIGKPVLTVLPARNHLAGEAHEGHGEAGTESDTVVSVDVAVPEPEPEPPAARAVSAPERQQHGQDQDEQEGTDPDGAFNLDYAEAYSKEGAVEYAPNPDIAAARSQLGGLADQQPNPSDDVAAAGGEQDKAGVSEHAKDLHGNVDTPDAGTAAGKEEEDGEVSEGAKDADEYAEAYGTESAGRSYLRKPPPKSSGRIAVADMSLAEVEPDVAGHSV